MNISEAEYLGDPLKSIGQTGSTFNIRYKEYIHVAIPGIQTTYQTQDTCRIIMDTMDVTKTEKKGKRLNTLEKYYLQMNDTLTQPHRRDLTRTTPGSPHT
jgi:hypothetical protein